MLWFQVLYYNWRAGNFAAVVSGSVPANLASPDLGLFRLTGVGRQVIVQVRVYRFHLAPLILSSDLL